MQKQCRGGVPPSVLTEDMLKKLIKYSLNKSIKQTKKNCKNCGLLYRGKKEKRKFNE